MVHDKLYSLNQNNRIASKSLKNKQENGSSILDFAVLALIGVLLTVDGRWGIVWGIRLIVYRGGWCVDEDNATSIATSSNANREQDSKCDAHDDATTHDANNCTRCQDRSIIVVVIVVIIVVHNGSLGDSQKSESEEGGTQHFEATARKHPVNAGKS
jgi:hypothetical protein